MPSTRRATLGDRAFPVAAARVWNSLPPETRTCSSLLTFRRETKSHIFRQSYGWLGTVHWRSADVCVELCNSFRCRFCKVAPQLCDDSTILTFLVGAAAVVVVVYHLTTNATRKSVLRKRKLRQGDCSVAVWWVNTYRIKCPSTNPTGTKKLILHPHADEYQNLITSRGSPLTDAYHVWLTLNSFVSSHRQTNKQRGSHNSTSAE